MAILPGTSPAPAPVAALAPIPLGAPARRILLVGAEAIATRAIIEQQLLAHQPAKEARDLVTDLATAGSLLEAGLFAGEADGEPRLGPISDTAQNGPMLYVVGVGPGGELEHLEAGLRTLRRINPDARIVLLCDPGDEVATRKARAWGADDYFILPLDAPSARRMLYPRNAINRNAPASTPAGDDNSHSKPREPFHSVAHPAAGIPAGPFAKSLLRADEEQLPALPLLVQTELLDDMLTGRSDFPQRAIARLSRHVAFNGTLRFVSGASDSSDEADAADRGHQIRRAVALPPPLDQPPFGTLILETETVTPAATAAVAQAANWLAGMLAVAQRYEQLRLMAITDELSGAYNRRYFAKYMASLLDRAKEKRFRITLLLFDIDDFKKYNDTFGHAAGDAIIRELIKLLRACTRPHDLVARVGGDEFAVVYWDNEAPRQPNSDHPKDALAATERFREAIRNHQWPQTCNIKGEVSISGGLASFPWDADTVEMLMAKADEALLKAKAAGKNVIVMHSADAPTPLL